MAHRLSRYARGFYLLTLAASCACAEELPDPTRPPTSITAPVVAGSTAPKPAGLQSIILSKNRRAAIIDGDTVELGGMHNGARLLEVNEGNVVMAGAQGRQVLTLFPDVRITSTQEIKINQSPPLGEVQAGQLKIKPAVRKEAK